MRRLLVVLAALASLASLPSPAAAAPGTPSIVAAPILTAQSGHVTVGYRSIGHGKPLVLIMGLAATMDAWDPAFVDGLARHHRVITFDNAGIRGSTAPDGPLTVGAMADETAVLIRVLHLRRPDVLGWSMGGMVAQALALEHPAAVRRLVLAATAPGDGHAILPSASLTKAVAADGEAAIAARLFPPGHAGARRAYAQGILRYPDAQPAAASEIVDAQLTASAAWLAGRDLVGHRLHRLRQQTLVATGTADVVVSPANARRIAQTAPHARLQRYRGAGHGFLFQDRVAVTAAIERFLR